MSTNQQPINTSDNKEEEVDLGSLFLIIGKGFSRLLNFIRSIFKGFFHFFITILLFLKGNSIKIGIAAITGLVVGFFIETAKEKTYASDLLLEPNFKSTSQLYKNINYYNDLVEQKDTATIQKTFKLDKETAGSYRKFTIEPVINDNDIINAYNDFILNVDTLTVRSYAFKEFRNSFTYLDYKIHKITVVAEKKNVFEQLDEVIISSVVDNQYFNHIKKLTNENLNRTDALLRQNLGQVDSLRSVYMQVMLAEAKKQSSGTSIDLGGAKKTTKEIELFETNRELNSQLIDIVKDRATLYEVINVISNFQPIGYEIKGVITNYGFLLGVLGAGLMILCLILIKLNTYLSNYKK